jgi:AraC family transcriptional regulator
MNNLSCRSTFALLNTDLVDLDKSWNYQNVISTFYRLYLIVDGEGSLYNANENVILEKGYLYLIPSFTYFNTRCTGYLKQYYLHFMEDNQNATSLFAANRNLLKMKASDVDIENFERLITLNPNRGLQRSHNPKTYEKLPVQQSSIDLNNNAPLAAYTETQGIILQLLSRFLVPECFKPDQNKVIHSKILDAINYIQTNLQLNITVTELAERANQNADHFSRLFLENTGGRPLAYIRHKRIERAQVLISTTNYSLSEIALETGFESLAYFSNTFKKVVGLSPGKYKYNSQILV